MKTTENKLKSLAERVVIKKDKRPDATKKQDSSKTQDTIETFGLSPKEIAEIGVVFQKNKF